MVEFTVKDNTVYEALHQISFLRNLQNIQLEVQIWPAKCYFNKEQGKPLALSLCSLTGRIFLN